MNDQTNSVLLVDDEPIAREVVASWLSEMGLAVTTADSATQALRILRRQRIDLLVADVYLQDKLDGFELVTAAIACQPHLRALFVSAKAWGPSQAEEPDTTFLHKPFSAAELARAARFALAGDQRLTSRCLSA